MVQFICNVHVYNTDVPRVNSVYMYIVEEIVEQFLKDNFLR